MTLFMIGPAIAGAVRRDVLERHHDGHGDLGVVGRGEADHPVVVDPERPGLGRPGLDRGAQVGGEADARRGAAGRHALHQGGDRLRRRRRGRPWASAWACSVCTSAPVESWIDDMRCGVMITPPLAMPAATIAFCSAVSCDVVLADGSVGLEGLRVRRQGRQRRGDDAADGWCAAAGRSIGRHRVDAEELGLLAQRRHALLHPELAVAGVAREREHLGHRPAARPALVAQRLVRVGERLALLRPDS